MCGPRCGLLQRESPARCLMQQAMRSLSQLVYHAGNTFNRKPPNSCNHNYSCLGVKDSKVKALHPKLKQNWIRQHVSSRFCDVRIADIGALIYSHKRKRKKPYPFSQGRTKNGVGRLAAHFFIKPGWKYRYRAGRLGGTDGNAPNEALRADLN